MLSALSGGVMVDRCTDGKGIWFDTREAEHLKDKLMLDYIDHGDPEFAKQQNRIHDINCPRCAAAMSHLSDPLQPHIQYEACDEHSMYFDAGEFTDYKHETLMDIFRDFVFIIRNR